MHRHKHGHRGRGGQGIPFWGMGRGAGDWGGWGGFGPGGFDFGDFGDFGWGRGGGGGQRRRSRSRMFGPGELRLVLLKLIADEPRHGYELMKALEELTGGAYSPSPGTVYPTLSLLSDEGAVEESIDGESTRKAFAATDAGKTELEERADEVEALMKRLVELGERRERHRSPEILRALMNLGGVLKHRVFSGHATPETMQEIVDIIDDAAKRIERL